MAQWIKLEKQKEVRENVFAPNTSVHSPLWLETRHKMSAVPFSHAVLASAKGSLLLSLTLLA